MNTVGELTDVNLDAAFAASYDTKSFDVADYYGAEIRERLTSVWSFATGMTGAQRFPKFESRLNFSQSEAARSAAASSSGAVMDAIGDTLKSAGITAAIIALAAVAVYAAAR